MPKRILVPVDNSPLSNAAADLAITLAKTANAPLVACHVFAAKLHYLRFRQMEFTLPEKYRTDKRIACRLI